MLLCMGMEGLQIYIISENKQGAEQWAYFTPICVERTKAHIFVLTCLRITYCGKNKRETKGDYS